MIWNITMPYFGVPFLGSLDIFGPAWLQNGQSPVVRMRWTTNGTFRNHHVGLVGIVVGSQRWHVFVCLPNKPVFWQIKSHRESSQESLSQLVCMLVVCLSFIQFWCQVEDNQNSRCDDSKLWDFSRRSCSQKLPLFMQPRKLPRRSQNCLALRADFEVACQHLDS